MNRTPFLQTNQTYKNTNISPVNAKTKKLLFLPLFPLSLSPLPTPLLSFYAYPPPSEVKDAYAEPVAPAAAPAPPRRLSPPVPKLAKVGEVEAHFHP